MKYNLHQLRSYVEDAIMARQDEDVLRYWTEYAPREIRLTFDGMSTKELTYYHTQLSRGIEAVELAKKIEAILND